MNARPYIVHEANYAQLRELAPNVAVLPWGATEAHNYHLPHGTDIVEATALGEHAVARAVERGARAALLPTVPFGNNNTQLRQVATITMRSRTQQAVLYDVAESLVRQGIDRLVLLNFHGGNEFKAMIRDVMLDLPIFIVQVHGYKVAPQALQLLDEKEIGHADEFETSLMLHLAGDWVAPLDQAGPGQTAAIEIEAFQTPGVWAPRDWETLTADTGDGNPKAATAEKGKAIFDQLVEALTPLLIGLSNAKRGDFPFIIRTD